MNSRNIIRDTSVSGASAGIAALLSVLQAIIVARLLGPASYGTLHIYRLIIAYTAFTNLGTFWAMVREMSVHTGKRDYERVNTIKNTAFTLNILLAVLTGVVVVIVFLSLQKTHTIPIIEVLIVGLIIIVQRVFTFSRHYFVAAKQFVVRSVLIVLFPLCNILFVLILGFAYGLKGVLLAMLLALVVGIVFSINKGALGIRFDLSKSTVTNLVKTGIPICGNGLLALAVASIDRLMIVCFLPTIQLGYYGIAAMIKGFMDGLYRSVFLTIFPRITEEYGKTNSVETIKSHVWKPLLISAHLSPLFFGSMILLIPPMVKYILPQYNPGVLAAQLIIASSFFGCFQVGIINFFITINKVHKVYPLRIAATAFSVVTIWIAIERGWGIQGVAFCFLLSSAFLAGLLIRSFLGHYAISFSSKLRHFASVYYPFLYMFLGLWITRFASFGHSSQLMADVLNTFFKLAVFFFLNVPLLLIIQVKTGILTELIKTANHLFETKILKNNTVRVQGDNL